MNAAGLAALGIVLLGAPVVVAFGGSPYLLSVATRAAVLALGAVSLQFALGIGGLVSFGHAAMLGIGAYTVLIGDGGDLLWALPLAMALAGLFAAATGLIALRAQGVTFLMITLAFGQMAYFVASSLSAFGGDDGMALDRRTPVAGFALLDGRIGLHCAVVASLVALGLGLRGLALSPFGTALLAAKENPMRAAALGFDVFRLRLAAYAVSGAGGGLAGFWLADSTDFVSPAVLDWRNSGHLLVAVILGSLGRFGLSVDSRLIGAAAAAVALTGAEEALALVTPHWALLLGPVLVAAALVARR